MKTPRYDAEIRAVVDAVLQSPGDADNGFRKAIADRSAALGGRPDGADTWSTAPTEIPPEIGAWTDKVAKHAYKTTPEELDALVESGRSEDAMFEITLAAAVGAAVGRMERGLAALAEARAQREAS